MPKAKQRDGAYQRKDRAGWFISYVDAGGERRKQKVEAHTRTQALQALSAAKTRVERDKVLGGSICLGHHHSGPPSAVQTAPEVTAEAYNIRAAGRHRCHAHQVASHPGEGHRPQDGCRFHLGAC